MTTSYFCWVRLVDVNADAKRTKVHYFHGDPFSWLKYGSRPPGVVEEAGRRPGVPSVLGVWAAGPAFFGRDGADTVFEYGPAFASYDDALAWLVGSAGEEWDKFALNRFLMSFHAVVPPTNNSPTFNPCSGGFPPGDWADEFKFKHERDPKKPLFDHAGLSLLEPADYTVGNDECLDLEGLKPLRAAAESAIRKEAHSPLGAISEVMKRAGLVTDGPTVTTTKLKLKVLRDWVIDSVEPSIYKFKVKHCRIRPWSACPSLDAMFADHTLKCYPGHPSFPSGHATLAYVFAYLIGHRRPQLLAELKLIAGEVAKRREIAGVHFASDSAAGKDLAEQMVKLMLDPRTNRNWAEFNAMLSLLD